ncbi:MAG: sulfatase [Deltaproteobacteria bacterium]|nr:MAG: sulfatase [Deltaproteobacteria bacterium]
MHKLFLPGPFFFSIIFTLIVNSPTAAARPAYVNSIGMKFSFVPAGSFRMGSPETEPGRETDETLHTVRITHGFYLSQTEVTQRQWYDVMKTRPAAFSDCGGRCPVENVSWNDCMAFIRQLNTKERTKKYRLPTEAEWEYACRAGTTTAFSSGPITDLHCGHDPHLDTVAWYCGNTGKAQPVHDLKPQPVGKKAPNAWGLYDMHGNVQEWCLDACNWRRLFSRETGALTHTYTGDQVNPISRHGEKRILRGGSWNLSARLARAANRSYYSPTYRRNDIGFRLVRTR